MGNPFAIDLQCNRKFITQPLWYSTITILGLAAGVCQKPGSCL
jgi:hypothetical protein